MKDRRKKIVEDGIKRIEAFKRQSEEEIALKDDEYRDLLRVEKLETSKIEQQKKELKVLHTQKINMIEDEAARVIDILKEENEREIVKLNK